MVEMIYPDYRDYLSEVRRQMKASGTLKQFAENLEQIIPTAQDRVDAFKNVQSEFIPGITHRSIIFRFAVFYDYQIAHYPYGKSIRGWRKWMKKVRPKITNESKHENRKENL